LEELHEILGAAQSYIDENWVFYPGRGRFCGKQWANSVQGVKGAIALYNLPDQESDKLGHCFLSFPARALNRVDPWDVWNMVRALVVRYNFKATRFDACIDDYAKRISYSDLDEAAKKGNYTGFRNKPIVHHSYDKIGQTVAWTFTFGSRLCDRLVRIYDKATESDGEIDSVRIEAELHDKIAQQAVAQWVAIDPENFEEMSALYLANVVVGSIKFIERTADKNVSRMPTLSWWQDILNEVGEGIRHTVKAVKTTLEEKKEWVTRQVSTTLAMFVQIMGMSNFFNYMKSELDAGQKRFTDYHHAFISHYKNDSLLQQSVTEYTRLTIL
jgi:DNA relaxase NicK